MSTKKNEVKRNSSASIDSFEYFDELLILTALNRLATTTTRSVLAQSLGQLGLSFPYDVSHFPGFNQTSELTPSIRKELKSLVQAVDFENLTEDLRRASVSLPVGVTPPNNKHPLSRISRPTLDVLLVMLFGVEPASTTYPKFSDASYSSSSSSSSSSQQSSGPALHASSASNGRVQSPLMLLAAASALGSSSSLSSSSSSSLSALANVASSLEPMDTAADDPSKKRKRNKQLVSDDDEDEPQKTTPKKSRKTKTKVKAKGKAVASSLSASTMSSSSAAAMSAGSMASSTSSSSSSLSSAAVVSGLSPAALAQSGSSSTALSATAMTSSSAGNSVSSPVTSSSSQSSSSSSSAATQPAPGSVALSGMNIPPLPDIDDEPTSPSIVSLNIPASFSSLLNSVPHSTAQSVMATLATYSGLSVNNQESEDDEDQDNAQSSSSSAPRGKKTQRLAVDQGFQDVVLFDKYKTAFGLAAGIMQKPKARARRMLILTDMLISAINRFRSDSRWPHQWLSMSLHYMETQQKITLIKRLSIPALRQLAGLIQEENVIYSLPNSFQKGIKLRTAKAQFKEIEKGDYIDLSADSDLVCQKVAEHDGSAAITAASTGTLYLHFGSPNLLLSWYDDLSSAPGKINTKTIDESGTIGEIRQLYKEYAEANLFTFNVKTRKKAAICLSKLLNACFENHKQDKEVPLKIINQIKRWQKKNASVVAALPTTVFADPLQKELGDAFTSMAAAAPVSAPTMLPPVSAPAAAPASAQLTLRIAAAPASYSSFAAHTSSTMSSSSSSSGYYAVPLSFTQHVPGCSHATASVSSSSSSSSSQPVQRGVSPYYAGAGVTGFSALSRSSTETFTPFKNYPLPTRARPGHLLSAYDQNADGHRNLTEWRLGEYAGGETGEALGDKISPEYTLRLIQKANVFIRRFGTKRLQGDQASAMMENEITMLEDVTRNRDASLRYKSNKVDPRVIYDAHRREYYYREMDLENYRRGADKLVDAQGMPLIPGVNVFSKKDSASLYGSEFEEFVFFDKAPVNPYMVGFLYDVGKVLYNPRLSFAENAASAYAPWLWRGEDFAGEHVLPQGCDLPALRNLLQTQGKIRSAPEALIKRWKGALVGVAVAERSPKGMLHLLDAHHQIQRRLGLDVPQFIITGRKNEVRLITDTEMANFIVTMILQSKADDPIVVQLLDYILEGYIQPQSSLAKALLAHPRQDKIHDGRFVLMRSILNRRYGELEGLLLPSILPRDQVPLNFWRYALKAMSQDGCLMPLLTRTTMGGPPEYLLYLLGDAEKQQILCEELITYNFDKAVVQDFFYRFFAKLSEKSRLSMLGICLEKCLWEEIFTYYIQPSTDHQYISKWLDAKGANILHYLACSPGAPEEFLELFMQGDLLLVKNKQLKSPIDLAMEVENIGFINQAEKLIAAEFDRIGNRIRAVQRFQSAGTLSTNVRLITSLEQNLEQLKVVLARIHAFKEYYARSQVFVVTLPPARLPATALSVMHMAQDDSLLSSSAPAAASTANLSAMADEEEDEEEEQDVSEPVTSAKPAMASAASGFRPPTFFKSGKQIPSGGMGLMACSKNEMEEEPDEELDEAEQDGSASPSAE